MDAARHTLLLVEDKANDVLLIRRALGKAGIANPLQVVGDGDQAVAYLAGDGPFADRERFPLPGVVLLDLNLPGTDGREVLAEVKADPDLRRIPVVVLSTSGNEDDVLAAYDHHVNAYIQKPVDLDDFFTVVRSIESFWLRVVELPTR